MSETYVTETIHGEIVKDGPIQGVNVDIKRLREAIPAHCFQPTIARSLSYVISDLIVWGSLLAGTLWLEPQLEFWPSRLLRFVVYPFLAGLPLTGVWVVGHECGHGAFSKYKSVNNFVGFLAHSFLLSPYFAWQSSHGRHHQYANNMSTDLNYVPFSKIEYKESFRKKVDLEHMAEDAPVVVFLRIVLQQILGWPWYLLTHITAGPNSSPRKSRGWWDNSHFLPTSSLFRPSEGLNIVLSDLGILGMSYVLYLAGEKYGSWNVVWGYVLPWMWVNHWIVMITYLHHTSPDLPKYNPESWTYLRGALATVDRDPGVVLKYMLHHIIDLHVIHHLFPRIPHYYAQDATDAIKPLLGPLYHVDKQNYWQALWDAFVMCQWVEPDPEKTRQARIDAGEVADAAAAASDEKGVLWYRSGRIPRVVTVMRGS
ncbi:fatty acid desaturase-domain-containing protein [Hypoxylon trugodes]|uniref:fatty acid desaturase-domain-containing protein n=1 Tax=Hypoxylon trugodes TaxID=326681 RepID=UPI00219C6711|nr:fatty acid desaturase-domain-containing protein [Hypoxylon trugodes]KAI1384256.1 fatty acid desaturase-domain-containing protein [Hypoxylon trugodes]